MNFHFIWIGSVPHNELIEKISNKARYLNRIFQDRSKNRFYLWTTSALISSIKCPLSLFNINFEVTDINLLFSSYDEKLIYHVIIFILLLD
jgi:hypothetical protein